MTAPKSFTAHLGAHLVGPDHIELRPTEPIRNNGKTIHAFCLPLDEARELGEELVRLSTAGRAGCVAASELVAISPAPTEVPDGPWYAGAVGRIPEDDCLVYRDDAVHGPQFYAATPEDAEAAARQLNAAEARGAERMREACWQECLLIERLHIPHALDAANAAHQCKARIRALSTAGRSKA